MKKMLLLLAVLASSSASVFAEGRVAIDMAIGGQDNLWTEDVFVSKKHRGRHYFDVFTPDNMFVFHTDDIAARVRKDGNAVEDPKFRYMLGSIGYQFTFNNGWYVGTLPSVGLKMKQIHKEDKSFTIDFVPAADPGLTVGKQFEKGSMLAKLEAFYAHSIGMRGALSYNLMSLGSWGVRANHSMTVGAHPERTRFGIEGFYNRPSRYAVDTFNGIRMSRGIFSVGFGYSAGIERQHKVTNFAAPLTKKEIPFRNVLNEKASTHATVMPRTVFMHDVLADITFAWTKWHLAFHMRANLDGERPSSGGMRLSYHF